MGEMRLECVFMNSLVTKKLRNKQQKATLLEYSKSER